MRWSRTLPVLILALSAQAQPALAAANKEHLQLMAEIRMLQEHQQQLQGLLGALQDTLKAVTGKLDEQSAATRKAMADQTLATTNIGDNVRTLREKTDETNVRISTMAQELESLRQLIAAQPGPQALVTPPAGSDPAAAAGTGAAPTPPPIAPPAGAPSGMSAQRMYETSYDDYTAGRWDLAIQGFQGYIQAFPRTPQAGNAMFTIGMSYYNQNKWTEARDAFQRVITDYPQAQGTTVPDSYYKLGQTFERLTQIDAARKMYEAAVQKFPGPPSALSNQALQRLNKRDD
jgi:tol-pal system protein YbgF